MTIIDLFYGIKHMCFKETLNAALVFVSFLVLEDKIKFGNEKMYIVFSSKDYFDPPQARYVKMLHKII